MRRAGAKAGKKRAKVGKSRLAGRLQSPGGMASTSGSKLPRRARPAAFLLTLAGPGALGLAACQPGEEVDALEEPCARSGAICTVAGTGERAWNGDGQPALATAFYWPVDLAVVPDGRAYVLDWQNHRVRRWDIPGDGRVTTVIGTDYVGAGPPDQGDLRPPGVVGTRVELNHPTDVGFLPDGSVLIAAWHNHKIRRLDPRWRAAAGPGRVATEDWPRGPPSRCRSRWSPIATGTSS